MSMVLSLTGAQWGALKNLLEAPEVEIDLPEMADLKAIYVKLTKEPKQAKIIIDANQTV